jgi:glycosyltransferase involved in cell wall biosynthesis
MSSSYSEMSLHRVRSRTMEDKVPVLIIYLGRRGGGAKITAQISKDLQSSKMFSLAVICIRGDNELAKDYDQSKVVTLLDNLASFKTIAKIIIYTLRPKKLLSDMNFTPNGICLVPMISPLGLIVECLLKVQGITVIRLLHDFERHPGDNWPPNFLIRIIIKRSKFLIALSSEVASKIKNLNPKIILSIYPHPVFDFSTSQPVETYPNKYVLFVGRIRKYKGVENLIDAFTRLKIKDVQLIVAGEGKLDVKSDASVRVINRWLEESEIAALIKNAEVVVFPYIEASQSGILPYCVRGNKKVVVTPLPGLLEQTSTYENAFIAGGFAVDELLQALNAAILAETFNEKSIGVVSKNIEESLFEIGIFTKK